MCSLINPYVQTEGCVSNNPTYKLRGFVSNKPTPRSWGMSPHYPHLETEGRWVPSRNWMSETPTNPFLETEGESQINPYLQTEGSLPYSTYKLRGSPINPTSKLRQQETEGWVPNKPIPINWVKSSIILPMYKLRKNCRSLDYEITCFIFIRRCPSAFR